MKKILSSIMLVLAVILIGLVFAPKAQAIDMQNYIYTVQLSTYEAWSTQRGTAQINLAHVYVKQIALIQDTTMQQTVTVYSNFSSTTAAAAAYTLGNYVKILVPATPGTYYWPPTLGSNQNAVKADAIDIPYLKMATDADGASTLRCKAMVIYGK